MALNLPGADHTFNVSQEHLIIALEQVALGFWEVSLSGVIIWLVPTNVNAILVGR